LAAGTALGGIALTGCDPGAGASVGEVTTLATAGASNPTVAPDGEGGFLVAWVANGETGGDAWLAKLDATGTPAGAPVRVNDIPGDADPHEQAPAQVATGPNGEVYVVWQRVVMAPWLEFGGADLRLAKSVDGGNSFDPAITVNDNTDGSPARVSFHNLAVAPDGTVYASWIDARVRDHHREMLYRENEEHAHAGGHGSGAAIPAGETSAMGSSPAGGGMGMMMSGEEPGTEIRMAVSRDGGRSFGSSLVVDENSCPCCRTALALGPAGDLFIGWRKIFDGGIRDIAVARSADGGRSFAAPRAVHRDAWEFGGCPHAGPSLTVADGKLHATWYTGHEERQGLWYAVSDDDGETFSEPLAVLTDDWVPPSQARLAVTDGEVWVAWDDLRQLDRRVRLARIVDGRLREVSLNLAGHSPMITFSGGTGLLAWLDNGTVRTTTFSR